MKRPLRLAGAAAILIGVVFAFAIAARSPTPTPAQRAHRLDTQLRCPVCQGLSVADSPSTTAQAISADVLRRVHAGESDKQIRAAYVARYGQWILLDPATGLGWIALAVPVALIVIACAGVALTLRRWSRPTTRQPSVDDVSVVSVVRQERERAEALP